MPPSLQIIIGTSPMVEGENRSFLPWGKLERGSFEIEIEIGNT